MRKSQRTPRDSMNSSQMNASLNASVDRKKKLQHLITEGIHINENAENSECTNILKQVKTLIDNSNQLSRECADSATPGNATVILNASENVMDAAVIKIGHEIVVAAASKLGTNEFSETVYAESVLSQIREAGQNNWLLYGERIFGNLRRPRFTQSLLGTFDCSVVDPTVKAKKERIVRQKAQAAELKRPEKVVTLQKEEKGAQLLMLVKAQIERAYVARGHVPFPYYELILDREDFMHTVDNAFHVAFLERDGYLGLACDANDDPVVYVATKEQQKAKSHDKNTKQSIVGLNYGKWMDAKRRYGANSPILTLDRSDFVSSSQATQMNRTQQF